MLSNNAVMIEWLAGEDHARRLQHGAAERRQAVQEGQHRPDRTSLKTILVCVLRITLDQGSAHLSRWLSDRNRATNPAPGDLTRRPNTVTP
jgi:hypothetical protein